MRVQPLVSVVIASYNHEHFIQNCIQSVIQQTYKNIELIIIDDGSTDNSISKILEMVDLCKQRFTHFEFRNHPNKGLTATLNEAIEWCQGEYYCPFASDDIMIKNKISLQLEYLKNHDQCAGVFGAYQNINSDGDKLNVRKKDKKNYNFRDIFLHKHELPAPTQLLKMSVIKKVGGYDQRVVIEDWYMWLKITESNVYLHYMDNVFVQYRSHDDNTSKKYDKMLDGRLTIVNKYKNHRLYREAVANCYLVSAHDYVSSNRKKSFNMYLEFLKYTQKINIFVSIKYILKFILYVVLRK